MPLTRRRARRRSPSTCSRACSTRRTAACTCKAAARAWRHEGGDRRLSRRRDGRRAMPAAAPLHRRRATAAARTVQIHENREARSCTVLTRAAIRAQGGAAGPLLVEDDTATIYVPPRLARHRGCRRQPHPRTREGIRMKLDPVDYAVISQALLAAAREMGTKLVRSAYSNIVREARDASCAILDPRRQHRRAVGDGADAAGIDEHDAARVPRAVPGGVAARGRLPRQQPSVSTAASTCRTCSSSARCSSTAS